MEVTGHSESGETCVVTVGPDETVHSLKRLLLDELGEGGDAARLALCLHGNDTRLDEEERICDIALEAGGAVDLIRMHGPPRLGHICHGGRLVSLSPCNRYAAVTTVSKTVQLFSPETHVVLGSFPASPNVAAKFSPLGDWIVSGHPSKNVLQLHCARTSNFVRCFDETHLVWTPCGLMLTGKKDCPVLKLWSPEESEECLRTVEVGVVEELYGVSAKGGAVLMRGEVEDVVVGRSMRNGEVLFRLQGHTNSVRACVLSANETTIYTSARDRTCRIWHPTGACIAVFLLDAGHTLALAKHNRFATHSDNELSLWSVVRGRPQSKGTYPNTHSFALGKCGKVVLVVDREGSVVASSV